MTKSDLFHHFRQNVRFPLIRRWYEHISHLDKNAEMTFMNYGWANLDPTAHVLRLKTEDEENRYCIQLYHRVASAVDLLGLNILEVGCGRGGGASYVMRYLKPSSYTGLDFVTKAIAFCKQHYTTPGLQFVQGNAQSLEFKSRTFDAVINVESSHCYISMKRFVSEVFRVLKPSGYFLFADHRPRHHVKTLRDLLKNSNFTLREEENISANVIKALELDNTRKHKLIQNKVPRMLRSIFMNFAGMQGTRKYYAPIRNGDLVYLRYVLQKC